MLKSPSSRSDQSLESSLSNDSSQFFLSTTCKLFFQNAVCKFGEQYYCYLCKLSKDKAQMLNHIVKNHINQCKNRVVTTPTEEKKIEEIVLNGIVCLNALEYYCNICNCLLKSVTPHLQENDHIQKMKSLINNQEKTRKKEGHEETIKIKPLELNNENNSENIKDDEDASNSDNLFDAYYCTCCHIFLHSDVKVKHHTMFHLMLEDANKEIDIMIFSITRGIKNIHCLLCDYDLSDEQQLESHLKTWNHRKRLSLVSCPKTLIISRNSLQSFLINFDIDNCSPFDNVLEKVLHCRTCDKYIALDRIENVDRHLKGQNHERQKLTSLRNTKKINDSFPSVSENALPMYSCFLCSLEFKDAKLLYKHFNNEMHKYRSAAINFILNDLNINIVISNEGSPIINCIPCKFKASDLQSVLNHTAEEFHKELSEKFIMSPVKSSKPNSENSLSLTFVNREDSNINNRGDTSRGFKYYCPPCKESVYGDTSMLHLQSQSHKDKLSEHEFNSKFKFVCPLCATCYFDERSLLEHFYDVDHVTKTIKRFQSRSGSSIINLLEDSPQPDPDVPEKYQNLKSKPSEILDEDPAFLKNYTNYCIKSLKSIYKINIKIVKLEESLKLTYPSDDHSKRICIPCEVEMLNSPYSLYAHLHDENHMKKLEAMERRHKNEVLNEQATELELATFFMRRNFDGDIRCLVCNDTFAEINLQSHRQDSTHKRGEEVWRSSANNRMQHITEVVNSAWYYAEKFYCLVCSEQVDSDVKFVEHLLSESHLEYFCDVIMKEDTLQYDICELCHTLVYGKVIDFELHCDINHPLRANDVPKMSAKVSNLLLKYEGQVAKLLTIAQESMKKEAKMCILVNSMLNRRYPNARSYIFNDAWIANSARHCDLYIFIDTEDNRKIDVRSLLYSFLECLDECDSWRFMRHGSLEGVPFMYFDSDCLPASLGVFYMNQNEVERSTIMSYLAKGDPLCHKFTLFIIYWASLLELKDFSKFTAVCVAIFYLQVEGILPSVRELLNTEPNWKDLDNCFFKDLDNHCAHKIVIDTSKHSLDDLIINFFLFFSKFDYKSDVICLYLGKVIKKSAFIDLENLPTEMNIYKRLYQKKKVNIFRLDSPLCIQDFVDLSINLTKSVSKRTIRSLRQYCLESANILINKK